MMKVTIAVPVYNTEKYLPECIESCIRQTYQDIEILLIDDGSTDGSGAVCDSYAAKETKVRVIHKPNGGVSSARNIALDQAEGKYLIFLDSDDCIHREMVEIYMCAVCPECVSLCSITTIRTGLDVSFKEDWKSRIVEYDRKYFTLFYQDDHVNSPCNKLYDMGIIREHQIRFDETLSLGEDLLFNLEYFKYAPSRYSVIGCSLYYYRENRDGSLVNSAREDLFELQLRMMEALRKFLQENSCWDFEEQRRYYGLLWDRLYLTIRIYNESDKNNSNRKVVRSALAHPVWKTAEKKCREYGLMNWKRILKKVHLELLRRW